MAPIGNVHMEHLVFIVVITGKFYDGPIVPRPLVVIIGVRPEVHVPHLVFRYTQVERGILVFFVVRTVGEVMENERVDIKPALPVLCTATPLGNNDCLLIEGQRKLGAIRWGSICYRLSLVNGHGVGFVLRDALCPLGIRASDYLPVIPLLWQCGVKNPIHIHGTAGLGHALCLI